MPIFIFDNNILHKLPNKSDARVEFIHKQLYKLNESLKAFGSRLYVFHGTPSIIWRKLIADFPVKAVYYNRDYEPYAKTRDQQIAEILHEKGIPMHGFKDHVVFESTEVLKADGKAYTVFTPYKRKWLERFKSIYEEEKSQVLFYDSKELANNFHKTEWQAILRLEDLGFEKTQVDFPTSLVPSGVIKNYGQTRDYPATNGTSRLGIHFRFGTISIREKVKKALKISPVFLNELIWRDFYSQILDSFPYVAERAFKAKYDLIEWRNNEKEFKFWCMGQTGYPIVDAGMRELNATGYMHNRCRMITASFLTKHLLVDWRWGEAYFAEKLLDFDLASNNGGWQWAAGTGTDAAPYFRIFNPYTQQKKFDKDFVYIKKWVPEWGTADYPEPIVDHKFARERCLETYKKALQGI